MAPKGGDLRIPLHSRDLAYMKPERYQYYFTLAEVSREVMRDPSWLRRLEKEDRIPQAHRVKFGSLLVRLWSPGQVDEIKQVISQMKRGRPSDG